MKRTVFLYSEGAYNQGATVYKNNIIVLLVIVQSSLISNTNWLRGVQTYSIVQTQKSGV